MVEFSSWFKLQIKSYCFLFIVINNKIYVYISMRNVDIPPTNDIAELVLIVLIPLIPLIILNLFL